jgi:hypothetical protein
MLTPGWACAQYTMRMWQQITEAQLKEKKILTASTVPHKYSEKVRSIVLYSVISYPVI